MPSFNIIISSAHTVPLFQDNS